MARMGSFDTRELQKLQQQLNKIKRDEVNKFVESCTKELAARLLAKVVKRTPVGDYTREVQVVAQRNSKHHNKGDTYTRRINPSGKTGGTLRRGWTAKTQGEAENGSGNGAPVVEYVNGLSISREGNTYKIEIINPVEYASYVEYGHRTRNHKGWVRGQFMMTISEQELERIAPKVLEDKIKKFLGGVFT